MTQFVSALADKGSETVVTVSEAFAKGAGLKVVDQPATDTSGRPLPARSIEKKKEAAK